MAHARSPAIFIGHGSPLNVLADNDYTRSLGRYAARLEPPRAVLVVSAHWLTEGPRVTGADMPEQIYDFWGFPAALYRVDYRPPGSPTVAGAVAAAAGQGDGAILVDRERGLDHAAWAVLRFLFPEADVPVLELSLDTDRPPDWHFRLGRVLRGLREEGVMILGSGNVVHNLREVRGEADAAPFPWAMEFDAAVRDALLAPDFGRLVGYQSLGEPARLSVPTPDHYLPLLYVLGAAHEGERVRFIHESMQHASVSMRSFVLE